MLVCLFVCVCVGVSFRVCARNWCCLLPFENFVNLFDCTS